MRWQTSITAVVVEGAGAVDELLLRVGLEATVLDQMGALQAANRGEGPAGATAALVLDWADSSVALPVPGVGGRLPSGSQR